MVPVLKELLLLPETAPARMVTPPVKVLVPLRNSDAEPFSITPVTLLPMIELIVTPWPVFVTVPVLLIDPVEKVIKPPLVEYRVKLLVPVTPPVKTEFQSLSPIVSVPVVVEASTIGLARVNVLPADPTPSAYKAAFLLPPALFPRVTVPVPLPPKASALVIA